MIEDNKSEVSDKKLSFGEKVGYGLGDTASCLIWQTISLYLLFFYTDVYGIEAAAAGFMIMILRTFDAFVDPIVGILADRTNTKWGKFRPFILWFALPLAVFVVMTFSTPEMSSASKLIYAYFTYGIMMILYSVVNIPYSSMLGVLTSNSIERTQLSSFKFLGAYVGGFIVSIALLPLANTIGAGDEAKGWQISMMIFSIVAVGLYMITFATTRERIQPIQSKKTSIIDDFKDLFSNRPWVLLLFVSLSMIMFVAFRLNITTYYFKYFIQEQVVFGIKYDYVWLTSAFNTIGMIFSILGVVVVSFVVKYFGKKQTFVLYFIIACFSTGIFYILDPDDILLIFFFQILGSFTGGPLSTLIWAMYADTADYSEFKNNRRATGLVFSAAIWAQKIGWAVGPWFIGLLLTKFGFSPNMEQNTDVNDLIVNSMSLIPVVPGVISIILVLFYKLDDKTMSGIESELKRRRVELKNN